MLNHFVNNFKEYGSKIEKGESFTNSEVVQAVTSLIMIRIILNEIGFEEDHRVLESREVFRSVLSQELKPEFIQSLDKTLRCLLKNHI